MVFFSLAWNISCNKFKKKFLTLSAHPGSSASRRFRLGGVTAASDGPHGDSPSAPAALSTHSEFTEMANKITLMTLQEQIKLFTTGAKRSEKIRPTVDIKIYRPLLKVFFWCEEMKPR